MQQPPYGGKGGLWIDTGSAEAGYQWVDGPPPPSATAASGGVYAVDPQLSHAQQQQQAQQAQQAQQQAQQQAAQAHAQQMAPPPGSAGAPVSYHYPGQGGAQWVDSPTAPPAPQPAGQAPAPSQDMVFQWVDAPNHGRMQPSPQQYLSAPVHASYYGMDSPTYGMPGRPMDGHLDPRSPMGGVHGMPEPGASPYHAAQGLDPYHAGMPPYPGGPVAGGPADATRGYPPPQEVPMTYEQHREAMEHGAYGQMPGPPSPQQGPPYAQRRDMHTGQYPQTRPGTVGPGDRHHYPPQVDAYMHGGAPGGPYGPPQDSYSLFEHQPGARPPHGNAALPQARAGLDRQPRGPRNQAHDDAGSRGRGRQGGRQGADGGDSRTLLSRVSEVAAAELQGSGGFENMGPDGLRSMLVTTLESLYQDRIKPMANYVKGRLKERSCPEVLVKNFVDLYAEHSDLFIVQRPANVDEEVTIFCANEPPWFKGWVDIDSPSDPYDEIMWEELKKFLDGEHTFAGGRYGMARELMQRNLPFLAEYSLGEVCHIVQLAIQHRRLIVYHRKMLKPIQTVLQPSPAAAPGAVAAGAEGEDIKDMDDLCLVLFRMLLHHPQGLRLCRLKQMIKHEFCRKLSEMSFQCTKLIELFNSSPLQETFVLDTENDGKSIYVRLGNPETFSDRVKQIYAMANTAESKAPVPQPA